MSLPLVIGVQRGLTESSPEVVRGLVGSTAGYSPMIRATLENGFEGNSVRSAGYFYNLGPGIYVGGYLEERDDGSNLLQYNPGRHLGFQSVRGGKRETRQPTDLSTGNPVWNVFTNTKVSLCSVAAGDWNIRSKWLGMDVHDVRDRSFNAFGDVAFKDIAMQCRTVCQGAR